MNTEGRFSLRSASPNHRQILNIYSDRIYILFAKTSISMYMMSNYILCKLACECVSHESREIKHKYKVHHV